MSLFLTLCISEHNSIERQVPLGCASSFYIAMLSVIVLNVVMLSVEAPYSVKFHFTRWYSVNCNYFEWHFVDVWS